MQAPPSVNTLLLHVFRTLAAAERSFSVGDLALEDNGLHDAILCAGGTPEFREGWNEYALKVPLTDQCMCSHCKTGSVAKEAIEFRMAGKYVQVRLRQYASSSFVGLLDMLSTSLGSPEHAVLNCHNRSMTRQPYSFAAFDKETYERICRDPARAEEENRAYSQRRRGNEFFVPTEIVESVNKHII
jgi:hypothetical protein